MRDTAIWPLNTLAPLPQCRVFLGPHFPATQWLSLGQWNVCGSDVHLFKTGPLETSSYPSPFLFPYLLADYRGLWGTGEGSSHKMGGVVFERPGRRLISMGEITFFCVKPIRFKGLSVLNQLVSIHCLPSSKRPLEAHVNSTPSHQLWCDKLPEGLSWFLPTSSLLCLQYLKV